MEVEYQGNQRLLEGGKVAFFCSREVNSRAVLSCYDWATDTAGRVDAIVSGFHSRIEQEVLTFLLQKRQPVVMVIARKMYRELPDQLECAMKEGRLLIISTAPKAVRVGREAALARNKFIATMADKIVFGYIRPSSELHALYLRNIEKSVLLTSNQPPETEQK